MRIGHYAFDIGSQGGIATYIRRLGRAQEAAGDAVFYLSRASDAQGPSETDRITVANDQALFQKAQALELDVLHLHRPVDELPDERVPIVRTMHGNQGSCPSGSRYLARQGEPCHRAYSVAGCLWGHLVDHCGSRRPQNIWADFKSIQREQRLVEEVPTLTVSRYLKEQMIRSGCAARNLHVLPSPAPSVEQNIAPPPCEGVPRFAFVGRIEPKKGVDWLLRAAAKVNPEIQVDIAGDGNSRIMGELKQLAARLELNDRVTFHGWLKPEEVNVLMRGARAVVFPSVWQEPAGLVTLEAASQGRPVIASRVGGIPEYAQEEFALLVAPRDVDGLSASMAQLAENPEQAAEMGRRAQHAARTQFSMAGFIHTLEQYYLQAIRMTQAHAAAC